MMLSVKAGFYTLLFAYPPFEFAESSAETRILIIGNGPRALEAIKAVYSCCQCSLVSRLIITSASDDPEAFEALIHSEMPGLSSGLVPCTMEFMPLSYELTGRDFDYIITCRGDISEMLRGMVSGRRRLVCYCGEGAVPAGFESLRGLCELASLDDLDISSPDYVTLERYAFNSDFAYSMGLDERCAKRSMEDFRADAYSYGSSLAFAAHIPCKLKLFRDETGADEDDLIQALTDMISSRPIDGSPVYDKLLELEHRRWSAYMISEGWRMPTDEELSAYAYRGYGHGGNDHRLKSGKLHPCLTLGGTSGSRLSAHRELWELVSSRGLDTVSAVRRLFASDEKYSDLTDLDAVSLALYGIVCRQLKVPAEDSFAFINGLDISLDRQPYENLQQASRKLFTDEENSVKLFRDALKAAKKQARDDGLADISALLDNIEADHALVIKRNERTDFFAIDSVMIDMLPFCLWYGQDRRTVITFSSGLPAEDVKVPAILSAERAVYLSRGGHSADYVSAMESFFTASRGGLTALSFESIGDAGVDGTAQRLSDIISRSVSPVINWVQTDDAAAAMAVGIVCERTGTPILRYSADSGIINIRNGRTVSPGSNRKSFSTDEFVSLTGGVYRNAYSSPGSLAEFESLSEFFFRYAPERHIINRGKSSTYSVWSALSVFFSSATKDETINSVSGKPLPPTVYIGFFTKDSFIRCGISGLLSGLNRYRIIRDYRFTLNEQTGKYRVSFTYFDAELRRIISEYENGAAPSDRQIRFNPRAGIIISDTSVRDAVLLEDTDHGRFREDKLSFVRELEGLGYIRKGSLTFSGGRVSFAFRDLNAQQLFKTQGRLFELILYSRIKALGIFDDVQTGVKICWDVNAKRWEQLILERCSELGGYGFANYTTARLGVKADISSGKLDCGTDNEIDIVMTRGMTPVFISCKTGRSGGAEWLNEISSISSHFGAAGVLAVTKNLDDDSSRVFLARARKMRISVIGLETISDETRFRRAMQRISEGGTVTGPETADPLY